MKAARLHPVAAALGVVFLLGTFLRLFEYFRNRPLWLDETMLALGIGRHGYAGLIGSLDYDQTAPPLFLWGLKTVSLVGGMSEYSLRLLPLLAGLALPWVVWRVVRVLGGPVAGVIATTLSALSVPLIYYSAEAKPYSMDALISGILIMLTLRVREEPRQSRLWWQLLIAGMLGGLVTIPLPLILAGAVTGLLLDPKVRSIAGARENLVGVIGIWAVGFGLLYWLVYQDMTTMYLHRFWADTFLNPLAPDFSFRSYTAVLALLDPLPRFEGYLQLRWFLLLMVAAVIPALRRTGLAGASQLVVPILATVLMSMLSKYPMGLRLLIFLSPCVFALVGLGLAELLRLARIREPVAALLGALLIVAWSAPEVLRNIEDPATRKGGREAAGRVQRADPAEPVYILPAGLPTWAYYSTDWRRPDLGRLDYFARVAKSSGPSALNGLVEEAPGGIRNPQHRMSTGRLEVIGRRSGLAYREPNGFDQDHPDPGWASEEVGRIVAAARPYVWVFGAHWVDILVPELQAEFDRRGIVVVERTADLNAVAIRVRIPDPGSARPATALPRGPAGTAPR
ncbi:MAG TPA: glycosyltransferase family 39 protein [Gemmatimonadales bacterium]|nr:glycosyltransferase family 39 protein [Gemmatimonadales bacterium]